MRAVTFLGAMSLAFAAAPANAAYVISINNVFAQGTLTTALADFSCGLSCPSSREFYTTSVNGVLSGEVTSLSGILTLTGQDRSRSAFTVVLDFSGGIFSSSSLTGFQSLNAPCTIFPCTFRDTTFDARSFAVTVRDTNTGASTVLAPVPEPASWAMMLVGFAAIGWSLRSARRAKPRLAGA